MKGTSMVNDDVGWSGARSGARPVRGDDNGFDVISDAICRPHGRTGLASFPFFPHPPWGPYGVPQEALRRHAATTGEGFDFENELFHAR